MSGDDGAAEKPESADTQLTGEELEQLLPEELEQLLYDIDMSLQAKLAVQKAYRSAVTLAAEEVQDQRLAALESVPETPFTEDLLNWVMVFTLQSAVATIFASAVQKALIASLKQRLQLQSKAFGARLKAAGALESKAVLARKRARAEALAAGKRQQRRQRRVEERPTAGAKKDLEAAKKRTETALAELEKAEKSVSAPLDVKVIREALRGVNSQYFPSSLVAAAKATQNVAGSPVDWLNGWQTPGPLQRPTSEDALGQEFWRTPEPAPLTGPASDTPQHPTSVNTPPPGVPPTIALRSKFEKDAIAEEFEIGQQHRDLERQIRLSPTADTEAEIREALSRPPLDLGALIDQKHLETAALIWAVVLGLGDLRSRRQSDLERYRKRTSGFTGDRPEPKPPKPYVVAENHKEYLAERFGEAAARWARSFPAKVSQPGRSAPLTRAELEKYIASGIPKPVGMLEKVAAVGKTVVMDEPTVEDIAFDLVLQWLDELARTAPKGLMEAIAR